MGIWTARKRRNAIDYGRLKPMPMRKKRKVTATPARKRRNVKRVQRYRSKKINLPKFGFLPDRVTCRLKATADPFTLDPGAGGIAVIQNLKFNTPFAGFKGRQPREWDETIALYNKCYIIGAKITVTALPTGTSANSNCIWGLYIPRFTGDGTASVPDYEYPIGKTYAKITEDHRLMKGTRRIGVQSGDNKIHSMTKKWSFKKWSGIDDMLGNQNVAAYHSTVSTDPAPNYTLGTNLWLVNRTNFDSGEITFNANIEYICVFTNRVEIDSSTA